MTRTEFNKVFEFITDIYSTEQFIAWFSLIKPYYVNKNISLVKRNKNTTISLKRSGDLMGTARYIIRNIVVFYLKRYLYEYIPKDKLSEIRIDDEINKNDIDMVSFHLLGDDIKSVISILIKYNEFDLNYIITSLPYKICELTNKPNDKYIVSINNYIHNFEWYKADNIVSIDMPKYQIDMEDLQLIYKELFT